MEKPVHRVLLFIVLLTGFLLAAGCSQAPVAPPPAAADVPSLTLVTDRTWYTRGDVITLTMTNGLDVPVWFIGYPQRDLAFWDIERARNTSWERLDIRLPVTEGGSGVCRLVLYERPVGVVMELKPHADLRYEWDQKLCTGMNVTGTSVPEGAEPGRYRFAVRYSLDTVKADHPDTEPWKRPVDLGGTTTGYSNAFVVT
jgi:hypothetical protein